MRVLVAEDNVPMAEAVRLALEARGHAVDVIADGGLALHAGLEEQYDVALLDLGLPNEHGLNVLRVWRDRGLTMPVMILSGNADVNALVEALNSGADDYLIKPFHMNELIARKNAVIRRRHGLASSHISLGLIDVDLAHHRVTKQGQHIRLTALEFALFAALALNPGQVMSKIELTEHLYAQDFDRDSNTLEVIVSRLRRKLGEGVIETVRGRGYRVVRAELAASGDEFCI